MMSAIRQSHAMSEMIILFREKLVDFSKFGSTKSKLLGRGAAGLGSPSRAWRRITAAAFRNS